MSCPGIGGYQLLESKNLETCENIADIAWQLLPKYLSWRYFPSLTNTGMVKLLVRECLSWGVRLQFVTWISKSLSWKMNRAQFPKRLIRIVCCLITNMKNYTVCENWMEHSLHPTLREYFFEVVNVLHTLTKANGNLAVMWRQKLRKQ